LHRGVQELPSAAAPVGFYAAFENHP
jgi:hypothetical protein